MQRRSIHRALIVLALLPAACRDSVGPALEDAGNVDVLIGASVVQSDSGVVVNGQWRVRHPSNGRSVWLDRFLHYEFGGFPELEYPQNTRYSDAWVLMLTHEKAQVVRNDSLIFSFIDHGDVNVGGSAMLKLTGLPHVGPSSTVAFENFVRYYTVSSSRVTWLDGHATTSQHIPYHAALVAGQPITLATTGSTDAAPTSATFSASPTATLIGLHSGQALELDRDTPPILKSNTPLTLRFDRPLDPARAYIIFIPWPRQSGIARPAFIQPRSATDRVVIPASVLAGMVANSAAARVAYRIVIEEFWWQDGVVAGMFAGGEPFSLPFAQESETTLHVYLER